MDGNQGTEGSAIADHAEDNLLSVMALCNRALQEITVPETNARRIEFRRRLDELGSALATVRTRLEVAAVLNRAPELATSGVGTSPMASEAVDRLLSALISVLAHQGT